MPEGIGTFLNVFTNAMNNHAASDRASLDRSENFMYGERSAENAFRRQKQLIDQYFTPEAQLKHLENAGLSPSLMYGGAGVTGTTSAPQGSGAQGIQTQYFPTNPLLGAQMANIMADTDKKKAETGTELLEQEQKKLQNQWQGIQNYIADATKETTIEQVQEQLNQTKAQIDLVKAQTKVNQIEYDFKSANFDNALNQELQKTNQLIIQTFEIESKERLNDAQTEFVKKQVENYEKELKIKLKQVDVQEKGLDVQLKVAEINKECQKNFVDAIKSNTEIMAKVAKQGQWLNLAGDILHCATDIAENKMNPIGKTAEEVITTNYDRKGKKTWEQRKSRNLTTIK